MLALSPALPAALPCPCPHGGRALQEFALLRASARFLPAAGGAARGPAAGSGAAAPADQPTVVGQWRSFCFRTWLPLMDRLYVLMWG